MNSEVRRLFHELIDLNPAERERVLAERRIDPALRAEVESLLNFDCTQNQDLGEPVGDAAADLLAAATESGLRHCGPYRLVRPIGAGGMGRVYLAERTDGELQQKVAVKLLPGGGYPASWRSRFLKERQLLAGLNHPAIVRVLDAGHTADGRPYLVMEYVEGQAIDVYAAALDWRDRLTLLLRVCDGVSHAHRRLVVHRDLKPSNILVDASGQPKLLDFGIAKLMDESVDATQTVERLLTPNYASPEQLSGASQTTATDVYSLGAVLYKLLTGRSPYESGTRSAQAADIIRGDWRIIPPSQLNRDLPADLDYILRKALRIETEARYASVDALACDIRAVLTSRPVEARGGDIWYRTRRFVRRHWVPLAAAVMTMSALVVGVYETNSQRALAQRRFDDVRGLANRVLALDATVLKLPGSVKVRHEIVAMSKEYLEKLGSQSRGDLDLTLEIAEAYVVLARAQGVPVLPNLGQSAAAQESLRKAEALVADVLSASPQDRKALSTGAQVALCRMIMAQTDHHDGEAIKYAQQAVARQEMFLRVGTSSEKERDEAAVLFLNVALAHKNAHRFGEAIVYARRSVDLARTASATLSRAAIGLSILADSLRFSGDLDGALAAIREARACLEKAEFDTDSVRLQSWITVLWREGMILGEDGGINLNRRQEAIKSLDQSYSLAEQAAKADPNDSTSRILIASAARELGPILRREDPHRALRVYELAIRRLDEATVSAKVRREKARLLAGSSYILRDLRRTAEAEDRIEAAFGLLRQTKDYPTDRIDPGEDVDVVLRAQADHFADTAQHLRAAGLYQELLEKIMAAHPDATGDLRHAIRLSTTYEALSRLHRRNGQTTLAADLANKRLVLWRAWERKLPNNGYIRDQLLAAAQR